jgi:hypothetical protein
MFDLFRLWCGAIVRTFRSHRGLMLVTRHNSRWCADLSPPAIVHIFLFLGKMLAHPFFRSGAIRFAHPDVKRIALSRTTRLHGNQEQANPKDTQKRGANRRGAMRKRHRNLREEVMDSQNGTWPMTTDYNVSRTTVEKITITLIDLL